ncbi:SEC-C motif-containing protein [Bacillus sp. OV194]|nr:SEC-C motif-containing protein [Bacillus sp. OV194]
MSRLPVVCNHCGNISPSRLVSFNGSFRVKLENNKETCLFCGKWGYIPDGVYNFYDNVVELLEGSPQTVADLKRLSLILNNARETKSTHEELQKEIEKKVPRFKALAKWLPKSLDQRLAYIGIVLELLSGNGEKVENHNHIEVNNTTEIHYHIENPEVAPTKEESNYTANRKIGRNELCPCYSGLKYKRCHGK